MKLWMENGERRDRLTFSTFHLQNSWKLWITSKSSKEILKELSKVVFRAKKTTTEQSIKSKKPWKIVQQQTRFLPLSIRHFFIIFHRYFYLYVVFSFSIICRIFLFRFPKSPVYSCTYSIFLRHLQCLNSKNTSIKTIGLHFFLPQAPRLKIQTMALMRKTLTAAKLM